MEFLKPVFLIVIFSFLLIFTAHSASADSISGIHGFEPACHKYTPDIVASCKIQPSTEGLKIIKEKGGGLGSIVCATKEIQTKNFQSRVVVSYDYRAQSGGTSSIVYVDNKEIGKGSPVTVYSNNFTVDLCLVQKMKTTEPRSILYSDVSINWVDILPPPKPPPPQRELEMAQPYVAPSDYDRDGILDNIDQCITQKETYNGHQDSDGCPDQLPPSSPPPTLTSSDGNYGFVAIIVLVIIFLFIGYYARKAIKNYLVARRTPSPPPSGQSVIFHYACPNCSAKLQPPVSPSVDQNCSSCGWHS